MCYIQISSFKTKVFPEILEKAPLSSGYPKEESSERETRYWKGQGREWLHRESRA
jgi:hypothetical protein